MRDGSIKNHVVVGQTTKDQVRSTLGSPSAQSTFGDDAWYYITERQEAWGFFKPEVVAQDTTRLTFDKAGIVAKIETFNLQNSQDVAMVARTTPTEGHTLGFFEQLLGNIGRFNAPSNDTSAPGRKSTGGY
ncbi:MAG: outer membrane protein assembly factor BamE [Pseudomonadota bacterium]|nr:outer membrane protein assembly factor BamE [Pseudomonadota bacterium]